MNSRNEIEEVHGIDIKPFAQIRGRIDPLRRSAGVA
jgi:hypothetical protein